MVLRFALIYIASSAHAQITTVPLSGFIVDLSNRAVSGAVVRVTDPRRTWSSETRSSESGLFRFNGLVPADYVVTASSEHFDGARLNVQLMVGNAMSVTITLQLVGAKQSVEVAAVRDDSADLGTVLTESRIRSLPLNRRDFLQLALL